MRLLAALVVSSPLLAQGISAGLRLGGAATPLIRAEGPRQASGARFTIGAAVEFRLWRGVAIGVDWLLRRSELGISAADSRRAGIQQWELPATLIYRWWRRGRPFVRAGVSINRVFDVSGVSECGRGEFGERFYCLDGSVAAELRHRSTPGLVTGSGLGLTWSKVRIEPEIRWTHWMDRNFGVRDAGVRSNLNQVALLVGILF